jgi:hypothetical protein
MAVYSPSGSGNVHVDQVLTNISIQWPINSDFVGPVLFPSLKVRKQSDKYGIFDREMFKLEAHDVRAPGTLANEIPGMTYSLDTYYANEHALQIAVTDEERENADAPLTPDSDGAQLVTQRILLGREKAMKDLATNLANYATNNKVTLSGTTQWNDYVNSTPIADFRTAVRAIHSKIFSPPNTAIIPWLVMSTLEDHPDFIERIKYSERAILTADIIASIIDIPRVIIVGAGYSTAGTGVPVTSSNTTYLWGKDVIVAYLPATVGVRQIGFGYEFTWGINGSEAVVDRWREEPRVSDVIRYRRRYDLKLVGHEGDGLLITAYLIKNAIL